MKQVLIVVIILALALAGLALYKASEKTEEPPLTTEETALTGGDSESAAPSASASKEEPPAAEMSAEKQAAEDGAAQETTPEPVEPVPAPDEEDLDSESPKAVVSGTVVDAQTNEPVENATILVTFSGADQDSVLTDADGAYSLEVLAFSDIFVVCRAGGYAQERTKVGEDVAPDEEKTIDFKLKPGSVVSGTVTDAATKQGIAGATVTAAVSKGGSFIERMTALGEDNLEATTGEDGTYMLDYLAPGSYHVTVAAQKQGYVFEKEDLVTLNVKENMAYEDINFVLGLSAAVEGLVVNAKGEPLTAEVSVMPAQLVSAIIGGQASPEDFAGLNANCDEEGRYTILGLKYDTEYRVVAEYEEYANARSESFTIAKGQSPATVDLTLTVGSTISGTAVFKDGSRAADHKIILFPDFSELMSGAINEPQEQKTDPDGTFSFAHVTAGKYTVTGDELQAMMPFGDKEGSVIVEPDGIKDITDLEIVVSRGIITGTVLSQTGQPVPDVRVEARQSANPMIAAGTTTEDDGSFKLSQLSGPQHDLSVKCDQGSGELKAVDVDSNVTIRLAPPALVSGYVVNAQQEGVPDCKVTLASQGESDDAANMMEMMQAMMTGGNASTTDKTGFFEFKNVTPGDYIAKAKHAKMGAGQSSPFSVSVGAEQTGVQIQLQPAVAFSGTVVNKSGAGVGGAMVTLIPRPDNELMAQAMQFMPAMMQQQDASATTEPDGYFEMANVAPGVYQVKATHSDYAEAVEKDMEVVSGHDVTGHRIVLSQGGSASGQVMVDGAPKEGLMVQFIGADGMKMATTDKDGFFEIKGISPGEYMVQAMNLSAMMGGDMSSAIIGQRYVTITDGQIANIDFEPSEGSVAVTGSIDGDLGSMTVITIRREGGPKPEDMDPMDMEQAISAMKYQAGTAFADAGGNFKVPGVEAGTYILEVHSMDINPMDMQAMQDMDRTPQIRQELVVVKGEPIILNLTLPASETAQE